MVYYIFITVVNIYLLHHFNSHLIFIYFVLTLFVTFSLITIYYIFLFYTLTTIITSFITSFITLHNLCAFHLLQLDFSFITWRRRTSAVKDSRAVGAE